MYVEKLPQFVLSFVGNTNNYNICPQYTHYQAELKVDAGGVWGEQKLGHSVRNLCAKSEVSPPGCDSTGQELPVGPEAHRRQLKAVRCALTFEERVGSGLMGNRG